MSKPLLKIENLSIDYCHLNRRVHAVREVDLIIRPGERFGIVGESGCGKSTLAMSILRLLSPDETEILSGRILFNGKDILSLNDSMLRGLRGADIGMVFQDPFSSLNPVLTIGEQIEEIQEAHGKSRDQHKVLELLDKVRLPDPKRIYASYPHQISGGQRQRVCLAMALTGEPSLLIADEPTTALDVTVQKEIMNLLETLRKDLNLTLLFITHNMGLISEYTDRTAVMYAGKIVEIGSTSSVLRNPLHPYTQGLLSSLPSLKIKSKRLPILKGQPPDLKNIPLGCAFHPRCEKVFAPCYEKIPKLEEQETQSVSCYLYRGDH